MQDIVTRSRGLPPGDNSLLLLAVICVKNCVGRHWTPKTSLTVLVAEAERPHIRATALRLLGECDGLVSTQVCQLAARLAKADWPRLWPELFPAILTGLEGPVHAILAPSAPSEVVADALTQCCRWLKALGELVKELTPTMTLPAQCTAFKHGSVLVMRALVPLYTQLMDQVSRPLPECCSVARFSPVCMCASLPSSLLCVRPVLHPSCACV